MGGKGHFLGPSDQTSGKTIIDHNISRLQDQMVNMQVFEL